MPWPAAVPWKVQKNGYSPGRSKVMVASSPSSTARLPNTDSVDQEPSAATAL